MLIVALIVIAGFAWYVLEPDERGKVVRTVLGVLGGGARHAAAAARGRRREPDAFDAALRARTPLPTATPAIAGLTVLVFGMMVAAPGSIGDPGTLTEWGANVGTLTSNGEWRRLLTSIFVHAGPLHLLVNVAAIVQIGIVLERIVGPAAFAAVYLTSGLFASLVSLATFPVAVSAGASGAIAGLYGLLVMTAGWAMLPRSPVTIPLRVFRSLAPVTAIFALYNLVSGALPTGAELGGALTGAICGAGLARGIGTARPPLRRVVTASASAVLVALACAIPLRGLADVRPELDRLVALEETLDAAYERAVGQFRIGAMSARQLAEVIERTIVPELQAAQARLREFDKVPREQQDLLARAEEYVRLRDESFRMRAEALEASDMTALRAAEQRERASLEALEGTRQ